MEHAQKYERQLKTIKNKRRRFFEKMKNSNSGTQMTIGSLYSRPPDQNLAWSNFTFISRASREAAAPRSI